MQAFIVSGVGGRVLGGDLSVLSSRPASSGLRQSLAGKRDEKCSQRLSQCFESFGDSSNQVLLLDSQLSNDGFESLLAHMRRYGCCPMVNMDAGGTIIGLGAVKEECLLPSPPSEVPQGVSHFTYLSTCSRTFTLTV